MKKKITDWGQLRFSVIGPLLTSPPEKGKLGKSIRLLAGRSYQHPSKDEWIRFGGSTIERWYYQALGSNDPVAALSRQIRSDSGNSKALNGQLLGELASQYKCYPHWSYQLHTDNLAALVEERPDLGKEPSYSTVCRRMKERGWYKKRRPKTSGQKKVHPGWNSVRYEALRLIMSTASGIWTFTVAAGLSLTLGAIITPPKPCVSWMTVHGCVAISSGTLMKQPTRLFMHCPRPF